VEDDERRDPIMLGLCDSHVYGYGKHGKPLVFTISDVVNQQYLLFLERGIGNGYHERIHGMEARCWGIFMHAFCTNGVEDWMGLPRLRI
jgi:hypothetical protein